MSKFYITTPLYYVNSKPHIGHSYTTIAADSLARYMRRKLGEKHVWLLTGTDEHGQKIKKVADIERLGPQDFADRMVLQFKDLLANLNPICWQSQILQHLLSCLGALKHKVLRVCSVTLLCQVVRHLLQIRAMFCVAP